MKVLYLDPILYDIKNGNPNFQSCPETIAKGLHTAPLMLDPFPHFVIFCVQKTCLKKKVWKMAHLNLYKDFFYDVSYVWTVVTLWCLCSEMRIMGKWMPVDWQSNSTYVNIIKVLKHVPWTGGKKYNDFWWWTQCFSILFLWCINDFFVLDFFVSVE